MFRSTWTILRELMLSLAKATILWNWSVKIHRYMTCGVVATRISGCGVCTVCRVVYGWIAWCLTKDGKKLSFHLPLILETIWNLSWNRVPVVRIIESDSFWSVVTSLSCRYVKSILMTDIVLILNPSPTFWLRPDSFRKEFGHNRQTDMIQWSSHLQSCTRSRVLPGRASSLDALPMQHWLHSVHIALWQHSITRALYQATDHMRRSALLLRLQYVNVRNFLNELL
jgi:hypothetical protein